MLSGHYWYNQDWECVMTLRVYYHSTSKLHNPRDMDRRGIICFLDISVGREGRLLHASSTMKNWAALRPAWYMKGGPDRIQPQSVCDTPPALEARAVAMGDQGRGVEWRQGPPAEPKYGFLVLCDVHVVTVVTNRHLRRVLLTDCGNT